MVRFDSWRAASLGNRAGRNLVTKSTIRWASNWAGGNASEARAGLESRNVDADPSQDRGRPSGSGRTRRGNAPLMQNQRAPIRSAGVVSTACPEGNVASVGE